MQQIVVLFFIYIISLFLLLNLLSIKLNIAYSELASDLGRKFFYSYVDPSDQTLGKLGNINIVFLIYVHAFIMVFIYYVLKGIKKKFNLAMNIPPSSQAFPLLALILALMTVALQTGQQYLLFNYIRIRDKDKTKAELIDFIFDEHYRFAQYCKSVLPGYYTADFFTDIQAAPPNDAVTAQRKIAYFLYPHIDIRISRKQPKDCIILFIVENPQIYVPQEYEIIASYKKVCHVAVRKDLMINE